MSIIGFKKDQLQLLLMEEIGELMNMVGIQNAKENYQIMLYQWEKEQVIGKLKTLGEINGAKKVILDYKLRILKMFVDYV